jgi:hypothetical protein
MNCTQLEKAAMASMVVVRQISSGIGYSEVDEFLAKL